MWRSITNGPWIDCLRSLTIRTPSLLRFATDVDVCLLFLCVSLTRTCARVRQDDMEFSFDFLNLFERTAGLLDKDPTLLCVSSWNDNSRASLGMDAQLLMRSSYFPGLGWMLKVLLFVQSSCAVCVCVRALVVACACV